MKLSNNQDGIELTELFTLEKKRDLESYTRGKSMHASNLGDFILSCKYFPLGYGHFRVIHNTEPEHLKIGLENLDCLQPSRRSNKDNDRAIRKLGTRINQLFKDRRYLVSHFFPKLDASKWHLIYFDQRDTSKHDSHWKVGSHIHFVSSLWQNISIEEIWTKIHEEKPKFSSAIHISYIDDLSGSNE